jgi:hypothetical protein
MKGEAEEERPDGNPLPSGPGSSASCCQTFPVAPSRSFPKWGPSRLAQSIDRERGLQTTILVANE